MAIGSWTCHSCSNSARPWAFASALALGAQRIGRPGVTAQARPNAEHESHPETNPASRPTQNVADHREPSHHPGPQGRRTAKRQAPIHPSAISDKCNGESSANQEPFGQMCETISASDAPSGQLFDRGHYVAGSRELVWRARGATERSRHTDIRRLFGPGFGENGRPGSLLNQGELQPESAPFARPAFGFEPSP